MTIIDIDKLIDKNAKDFRFKGKDYSIRPISYRQTIEMSKIEDEIGKEENTERILRLQAKYINFVIPELPEEYLMDAKMPQIQKIQELIREVLSGQGSDDELVYYRNKYNNEYQKNLERVGEKTETE